MTIQHKRKLRIAILFHENDRRRDLRRYDIMHVARYWEAEGHEVIKVFGTKDYIPADIAILHIDLSLVPQRFIDLANRYPVCLNKQALDIRKSAISAQLLRQSDDYSGQVIIKSNENSGGVPERLNGNTWTRAARKLRQFHLRIQHRIVVRRPSDYLIFDRLGDVPDDVFSRTDLVVEKFLPERDGEFYCTRAYLFMGSGQSCQMTVSRNPLVSVGNCERLVECDIHPRVIEWRQQLGFDYGKFDYVIHDGQVVLLDANKTTGSGNLVGNPMIERFREIRANGLLDYYENALTEKNNMANTSVIITTYNNPAWLQKVLWSFSCQTHTEFEVVIADDGSTSETRDLIDDMRAKLPFKILHVWQEDDGFRKCRILNRAIMQASGGYLIFTDGDCIARRDFVETHLKYRKPGAHLSGDYVRLPMSTSDAIAKDDILTGRCFDLDFLIASGYPPKKISQRLKAKGLKARFLDTFSFVQANWYGNNASGWKKDLVAINGFDERMAYGGSDWEFGDRLNRSGIRRIRVRYRAISLHLEHSRGYADPELVKKNKILWNEAIEKKTVWTDFGISLHAKP